MLTQQVGKAGQVFLNVNKANANLHMVIPIFKTAGLRPIDLSIIFSNQDRSTLGEFGYGTHLNLYKSFVLSQDKQEITVTNADGSCDTFSWKEVYVFGDVYECKAISSLVKVSIDSYTQEIAMFIYEDKYGNQMSYHPTMTLGGYSYKNGDNYTASGYTRIASIDNNKGMRATFIHNANETISRITFLKNNYTVYRHVDFVYGSGFLLAVVQKRANGTVIYGHSYYFNSAAYVSIHDGISQYRIKYTLTNGRVSSIKDGYDTTLTGGLETTITYYDHYTKVVDYEGNYVKYYFDKDSLPLYDIDNKCRAITYNYKQNPTSNAIQLLAQSNSFDNDPAITEAYNQITNGYFVNNLDGWTTSGTGNTSIAQDSTNPFFEMIGGNVLNIWAIPGGQVQITQSIPMTGLVGDDLTLSLWMKEIQHVTMGEFGATVSLIAKRNDVEVGSMEIPINNLNGANDQWNLYAGEFKAEQTYDSVTISIKVFYDSRYHIDGILLRKTPLGAMFTYNEDGNLTTSIINKASTNYDYTKGEGIINHLLKQLYNPDSSLYNLQYDQRGNMIQGRTAYEVSLDNTYDNDNNLVKSVQSYKTEKFETETTFSSSGSFPVNQTNELGFITAMNFEETYGRLMSITDPNQTSVAYTYNDFDNLLTLVTSKNSSSASAVYTYDSRQRIETITTPNSVVYKFFYDSQNKLLNVKIGRTSTTATNQLFGYEYENQDQASLPQTGIIKKSTLGSAGDSYQFIYNDDNQLTSIEFKEASQGTYTSVFSYTYDEGGRLVRYDDNRTNRYLVYTYNAMNQVVGVTDQSNNEFIYDYDSLGNVRTREATLGERIERTGYSPQYRGKGFHPEAIYRTFQSENYAGFFNEFNQDGTRNLDLLHINEDGTLTLIEHENMYVLEDLWKLDRFIPQILYKVYTMDHLAYKVNCIDTSDSLPKGSISFWFKPTTFNGETNLLWSFKVGVIENSIRLFLVSETQLRLVLKRINDAGTKVFTITETIPINAIELNDWHFLSLSWNNILNSSSGLFESIYNINFDGINHQYNYQGGGFVQFSSLQWLHIGCRPLDPDPSIRKLIGSVTAVMASPSFFLNEHEISRYYRLTKEYLFESSHVIDNQIYTNSGVTDIYSSAPSIIANYNVVPLNNSVNGFNNVKPVDMSVREAAYYDRDPSFNYNPDIKRCAYVCDGSKLEYDFNQQESGFISLRVYFDETHEKQTIFDLYDASNGHIHVYRYNNPANSVINKIYFKFGSQTWQTEISLANKQWANIAFSWTRIAPSEYTPDTQYNFILRVNNNIFYRYYQTVIGILSPLKVRVATDSSGQTPLYGHVEMLVANSVFHLNDAITSVFNNLKTISCTGMFDQYNRLVAHTLSENGTTLTEQSYTYSTRTDDTNKKSHQIKQETFVGANDYTNTLAYFYDDNGNVSLINQTGTAGTCNQQFIYNYRGFLEQEITNTTNFKYIYDNNGNITSILDLVNYSSIVLTYDNSTSGIWADRLLSYDGKEIKYDPKFLGNPKYFGTFNSQGELISGITYGWEGKNLTYYHNSETQKEITYAYNDANLRISKTVNSVLTSYTYEGNRLVMEQSGTKTKRFLYDEMGLLIGFSYQNGSSINRYFYIRDQLGHILGIVDTLGTVVVRYTYDAWGNILSVTGSLASTIGQENPFRYKGYYYDSETGYYYCQSRYYVPMWCRWLSSDKVSYLNPESINGINLYMYCGNNPVMYADPTGHSVLLAMFIGFLVGSLIGGTFEIGKQISNSGWNPSDWDWKQIGFSTLGGGMAGSLSAIPISGSGIFSYLGTFMLGGTASVTGGLISGAVDNWQTALLAFGIGGLANVGARGITTMINRGLSAAASKQLNQNLLYKNMTLADLIATNVSTGSATTIMNKMASSVSQIILLASGYWSKSAVYSLVNSTISSLLSGWF
jgi:RHS repeat-associated protein